MQQSLSVFLSLIDEAFIAHESWRKTKARLTYDFWAEDFTIRLNQALTTWLGKVGYAAGLLLKSLRDQAEQWWYFLNDPSVPPDNNKAERSLRLAGLKQKLSPNKAQTSFISRKYVHIFLQPAHKSIRYSCSKS